MLNGAVESWGGADNNDAVALRPAICILTDGHWSGEGKVEYLEMRAMAIAVFPNQAREARYLVNHKCHQCPGLFFNNNLDRWACKLCMENLTFMTFKMFRL